MDPPELRAELRRSLLDVADPHQSLSCMLNMSDANGSDWNEVEALIDRLHAVEADVWALARRFL